METRSTTRPPIARSGRLAAATALLALLAAAPASAQAPGPEPCGPFYQIRDGDRLSRIAEHCGLTIPALLAANPMVRANEDLQVGAQLRIPPAAARQPTPQQACGAFYTVRTGDTLDGIARKCGLTVPLILAANGPFPEPLRLQVGSVIRIPDLPRTAAADARTWAAAGVDPGIAGATIVDPAAPPGAAPATATDPLADPAAEPGTPPLTRLQGTLAAGQPCMLLRGEDGRVHALDGRLGQGWRPGERVVVMGLPGDPARCGGHQPTFDLRILHRPG